MAITLTVEDGSIVSGANTYIDVAYFDNYSEEMGYDVSGSTEDQKKSAILRAMRLAIETSSFKSNKSSTSQPLEFPRSGFYIDSMTYIDSETIPQILKRAVAQSAYDAISNDLLPNSTGREVIKEKLDEMEIQYSESGSATPSSVFRKTSAYLAPLLQQTYGRVHL